MRSLVALSLVGAVCAPAWARPDHDHIPPGALRGDVQMRMPVDGRGDTASPMMRQDRPEPWQRAEKPVDRPPTTAARADLPLKPEVAQKAHPGDQREVAARPQALDARAQATQPGTTSDRFGRPEARPQLPIKIDVAMKAQQGDRLEPAAAAPAAKSSDKSAHQSITREQRELLCKATGVCLPMATASDDVEDKTR
jgi:hypothetical protein